MCNKNKHYSDIYSPRDHNFINEEAKRKIRSLQISEFEASPGLHGEESGWE